MASRVGPYILTTQLGQGSFGVVMLGTHQATGVEYAVKVLSKDEIKRRGLTDNVRREIAIMKALSHKNVVNLHEVLSSSNRLYFVMDLVRGGELFDMVDRQGPLPESLARRYFHQLIDGIDYCHRVGVIHRDIKPENLLVDDDGTLKVSDFGMSRMNLGGSIGSPDFDLLQSRCGTPYYCAPELVNGDSDTYSGSKVDAWSCGVVLYVLLTGTLPFHDDDLSVLSQQICASEPYYPPTLAAGAKNIIARLLEKDPEARYSLGDARRHPWFLVEYVGDHASADQGASRNDPAVSFVSADSRDAENSSSSAGLNPFSSPTTCPEKYPRRGVKPHVPSFDALPPRSPHLTPTAAMIPDVISPRLAAGAGPALKLDAALPMLGRNAASSGQGEEGVEDGDLMRLVAKALPGKSAYKVAAVVAKLEEIDMDCTDDVLFLGRALGSNDRVARWLEEKTGLPALTCLRITSLCFQQA